MSNELQGFGLQAFGVNRFFEVMILALAWILLCLRKRTWKRLLVHFAVVYPLLLAANLLCQALASLLDPGSAGTSGLFHILWALSLGAVSFLYLRLTSGLPQRTLLLVWLSLFSIELSITSAAGQCGFLLQDAFSLEEEVGNLIRFFCCLFILPLAGQLREYHFEEHPMVPRSALMTILLSLICVLLLCIAESRYFMNGDDGLYVVLLISYLSMLSMVLMATRVMSRMCREQSEMVELQAEKQRLLSEREMAQLTEAKLEDLRCIRHDLKNQYAYMQILLSEKRYGDLESYFSKLSANLPAQLNIIDCGNHTINTVLNMEFAKLRDSRITLEHQLVVPPVLPFKDDDICGILANLLDNAGEECRRLLDSGAGEARIRLEIYPHQIYLYIKCINTTDRTSLSRLKGGLITTKLDRRFHGYGTRIVSRLAEKYNGAADYSLEDGQFVAQVMLDMSAATEEKANEDQNRTV